MCKSKPEYTKEDLEKCQKKVASLEQLITTYSGEKATNMRSSQTNLGVFSIGVEQNNNDCECSGIWGILEVIAAIGLFLLTAFLLFRCISAYCEKRKHKREEKQRNMVELLDRSWNERERANNKDTAIDILAQADKKCSWEHLHMPARPDMGPFE